MNKKFGYPLEDLIRVHGLRTKKIPLMAGLNDIIDFLLFSENLKRYFFFHFLMQIDCDNVFANFFNF